MKLPAFILIGILLLNLAPTVFAGDSNVNVRINNRINSVSNNSSSSKTNTSTKVHISQEGEGTSSVTINGEEWKLEGPGEINVNNSSNLSPAPTQSVNPTTNPTSSPTSTPTPTTTTALTPTPTGVPSNHGESPNSLFEAIRKNFEEMRESLEKLFSMIFGNS